MATNLKAWNLKESDFPKEADDAAKIRFMLHYAVLAPSSWNAQPWKFKLSGNNIKIYHDIERIQPQRDPHGRENIISCGAALCNLLLAMHRYGYEEQTHILPDKNNKNLIADITWKPNASKGKDNKLFKAIQQRHSFRKSFKNTIVPDNIKNTLINASESYKCSFALVTNESLRMALAGMILEADKDLGAAKKIRQEYASWVRSSGRSGDGVPGYALGLNPIESILAPLTHRLFNYTDEFAHSDHKLTQDSTLIGVLSTQGDNPEDWIASGQAIQKILLSAASNGIQASFLNQLIPVPELRERLKTLLNLNTWPQLIIRLGYPTELDIAPTPRRKIEDVIIS